MREPAAGFMDEHTSNMEKRKQTDALVTDFSKAFDKACYRLLVHKPQHCGITGKVNTRLHDFLADRKQVMVTDGATSGAVPVEYGAPQGSDWGPAMLLLYITDLPMKLSSNARLFADVTLCLRIVNTSRDHEDLLLRDLDSIAEWEVGRG